MDKCRVWMSKYKPERFAGGPHHCDCGQKFCDNETVALYPLWNDAGEILGVQFREVICMTCHFWIVNDVMESADL